MDLQPAQAPADQAVDERDAFGRLAVVGEDGQAAGGPDGRDRLARTEPPARDVRRTAATEDAREGMVSFMEKRASDFKGR